MNRHGEKQPGQTHQRLLTPRQRIRPHDFPEINVARNQKGPVHDHVAGVIRNRSLVPIKIQVQRIKHKDELREVHWRIGNNRQPARLAERPSPIMQVRLALLAWLPGRHDQRQRRAQHQEHREGHRQQHVADHVHRKRRRNNHADARAHNHRHAE